MTQKLYEKFSWLKQDLIYAGPKGSKAQFKGVALLPTISGNGRRYVEEELHRSARTLVGKPLTLNHNSSKVLGDVTWAEFENGVIEYVAETKSNEYTEKLRDRARLSKTDYVKKWGRDPIYGVSVEANYRYHDEQCVGGHCTVEPHGIIFNALSLVEDPERPGVGQTTVELMETMQNVERQLTETLVRNTVPKELQSSVLTEGNSMMKPEDMKMKGKDEGECPEGQMMKDGKCVQKDEAMEAMSMEDCMKTGKSKEDCEAMMKKQMMKGMEIKKLPVAETQRLKLGEPFAEYSSFEDCVAQNKGKDNPEAYCGTIKKQTEETLRHRRLVAETVNAVIDYVNANVPELERKQANCCSRLGEAQRQIVEAEALAKGAVEKLASKAESSEVTAVKSLFEANSKDFAEKLDRVVKKNEFDEAFSKLPNLDEKLKPITEKLATLPNVDDKIKPIQEAINALPNIDAKIQDAIAKLPAAYNDKPLTEKLAALENRLTESDKKYATLNSIYEVLNKKYEAEVKKAENKKLQETQETKKLQETLDVEREKWGKERENLQDQIDTLKKHVSPNFQAKPKPETPQEPNFAAPYTYTQ